MIMDNVQKKKTLVCEDGNVRINHQLILIQCPEVKIGSGSIEGTEIYKGVMVTVPKRQDLYTIYDGVGLQVWHGEMDATYNISNLRLVFAIITLLTLFGFWKRVSHLKVTFSIDKTFPERRCWPNSEMDLLPSLAFVPL